MAQLQESPSHRQRGEALASADDDADDRVADPAEDGQIVDAKGKRDLRWARGALDDDHARTFCIRNKPRERPR
jgi:hypothetical protein